MNLFYSCFAPEEVCMWRTLNSPVLRGSFRHVVERASEAYCCGISSHYLWRLKNQLNSLQICLNSQIIHFFLLGSENQSRLLACDANIPATRAKTFKRSRFTACAGSGEKRQPISALNYTCLNITNRMLCKNKLRASLGAWWLGQIVCIRFLCPVCSWSSLK